MKGLILNLGLKSVRAVIFSDGKRLAYSSEKIHTFLNKDFVEQDADEWWEKGLNCMKEVIEKEKDLDFITVSASSACLIPVDKDGMPLMRAIMVSDKRSVKEAEQVNTLKSFKKLQYHADPYYSIPKILWIKNNEPEVYEKTHKFLSPNDFLLFKLTKEFCIDELNATKYYTLDNKYSKDLLNDLEIAEGKLPKIKKIGHIFEISEEFMVEAGLSNKTKIVMTTYDAICSFFGSGAKEEGDACDISGTVTSLRVLTKKNIRDTEMRIFQQKVDGWNLVGASNNLGGGLIEWVLETFYSEYKHEDLEKLSDVFAAKTGLIFLPYLLGERAPLWDSDVRGAFLGIERFHTKYDKARAVLESTGFILKNLVEALKDNDITIKKLYVSGGLSRIGAVNQIKSDVLGTKVYKMKETESTSLGAYVLARQAFDDKFDSSVFFNVEKVYEPDLTKHEVYLKVYKLFKQAYTGLKEFHNNRRNMLENEDMKKSNL
jgi:xylulokinase